MFTIYIDNENIELFKEENIELVSRVSSIEDISKSLSDFSKSFTVPASSNNNRIFKHYYNANIDNTFDARTKAEGRIDLNGFPFRYGKFKLEKVIVKQGNPYSYQITFFGNAISLKDKFKNDELSYLDLSAHNHAYNSTNVKEGMANGLFGGSIVYSMLAKKQYYYKTGGDDGTLTATLANIAWDNGGFGSIIWSDLQPSISVIHIIEAIESNYDIQFSRHFFGREEFQKMYMWLNNSTKTVVKGGTRKVDFDSGDDTYMNYTTNIATYPNTVTNNGFGFSLRLRITPNPVSIEVPYKVSVWRKVTGVDTEFLKIQEQEYTGFIQMSTLIDNRACELYYEIESSLVFNYNTELYESNRELNDTTVSYGNDVIAGEVVIANNIPKIKVIDFLSGLFKMFKLVVVAEDDGTIYINTINDYYAEGSIHDLTKYVNTDDYDVEAGKLLNPINFKFEAPQTLLNQEFTKNTGQSYGDEELILQDADGEQLDGQSYDIKLPFEQIVYERLPDINTGLITPIMYGGVFDNKIEGVNPKPHLHYNHNVDISTAPIGFLNDSFTKDRLETTLNIPSHTITLGNPAFSLVFGKEINEWNGQVIENTLYSNYYSDYIRSVFNIKKRVFKFKSSYIPFLTRLKLKLNDVIKIQENYYRIDSFTTNLNNGNTSFDLVNSFDNVINAFTANRNTIITDYQIKTESTYVTNGGNFSFNKIDLGFGVGWVTVSNIGSNVYFTFAKNLTGNARTMNVEITNTLTFQTIVIALIQTDGAGITADNNIVTADNFNLTVD